jgi:hypothetical protein
MINRDVQEYMSGFINIGGIKLMAFPYNPSILSRKQQI